jgi:hypothetical protein
MGKKNIKNLDNATRDINMQMGIAKINLFLEEDPKRATKLIDAVSASAEKAAKREN